MSNIVPYRIQLDIKEVSSQLSLSVALGDTGRKLIIQLVDDGKEFELGRGTYAVFTALKPDGNTLYNDCTIQDNQIIYNFTEQTTSCEGITDCQIVLYDATGYLVTAPRFAVIVYDAIRSRVDIQSASENLAIDEIAEQEAYRQLQEAKRQDNEGSRVLNEEARTINEAYRIATGNVIKAFLDKRNILSLESPTDILSAIDMNIANARFNNYFACKDELIKGIAIVGNTPTEGDITTIDTIEPHKIYRYKGLRFVPVTVDVPESSILDDISEMVEQAVQSAEQAEMWAENANTIAVQKPTVYFESNFQGLLVSVLYYDGIKQGDIFILTESDQPDFVALSTDTSIDTSNVVNIKQEDIPHNVPTPEVGKIYAIEGKDYALIAIESGIQTPATDSALNANSTNPVQNKVITAALRELENKIGTSGGNITVEQEVNDSDNPVSSVAVQNEFQKFVEYYDDRVNALVVKQEPFINGTLNVFNNFDYHAIEDISNLSIVIPDGNILCSIMFKTADSGTVTISIDGVKGYIGKAPDFKNGETWELSIHNGIIASGKVVSE